MNIISKNASGSLQRRYFTLTELVVICFTVVIFAGLCLPVIAQTGKAVTTTRCIDNLKKMGVIFTQYANDHDGVLMGTSMPIAKNRNIPWNRFLSVTGYVGERSTDSGKAFPDFMLCPDFAPFSYKNKYMGGDIQINNAPSYGLNASITYSPTASPVPWGSAKGINLKKLPDPVNEVILADSTMHERDNAAPQRQSAWFCRAFATSANLIHARHNNSANLLMGDMHVANANSKELLENLFQSYEHVLENGTLVR